MTGLGAGLQESRVSRWERGLLPPSAKYQDALCRVYQTGPVDLGFDVDYAAVQDDLGATPRDQLSGDGPSAPVVARAESVRRQVGETLAASALPDAVISSKEAVAAEYGRTYKVKLPLDFLSGIVADLDEVQGLTDRKLPAGQRRDLCAVTAQMSGLVSMTMVNLGCYRQARDWVHTARLAADETGDPRLRAWVATRAAVASFHLGDLHGAATAAREAEVLTHRNPCGITAMAWAILGRVAAKWRDISGARAALRNAERLFESAHSGAIEHTAYLFTPGQFHFYRSNALTTIDEASEAWAAQDQALAAFAPGELLDPTLVRLDRAMCMVAAGDPDAGAEYASSVMLELPPGYRPAIIERRALAVTAANAQANRGLRAA